MICKHCGKETANVICDNCGMNVVWYNKWGIKHDVDNPGELAQYDMFIPQDDVDIEQDLLDFVPDGSGD
jgi:hypothetical protein